MTKTGTVGVDFVIPVVMRSGKASGFGPFLGPWTDEQEAMADLVVSYILIQTKHRVSAYRSDAEKALIKCIPIPMKPRPRDLLPNFANHTPTNSYISVVMELGIEKQKEKRIQVMNTIDYAALDRMHKRIVSTEKTVEQKRRKLKNATQSRELKDLESRLEKEKEDYEIELSWLPIREKQLPIVAYGLSQDTYKCLENRPNVTRMLHQLAQPYLNSLRGLSPPYAAALRAGRHVMINPDREYVGRGSGGYEKVCIAPNTKKAKT